jgi:hypothetical protein
MTVCIAAITRDKKRIFTATDQQIQLSHFAGDNLLLKNEPIHLSWAAMVAGNDVTASRPIFNRVREELGFVLPVNDKNQIPSVSKVAEVFERSYAIERRRLIESNFLASFNMTLEDFKTNGASSFPDSTYREMWKRIDEYDMGCEFLISGFDAKGHAHILGIDHPGVVREYTDIRFWAIGSGQHQALSILSFLRRNSDGNHKATLYQVCAAKFFAETEPSVGRSTFVLEGESASPAGPVHWQTVEEMRALWDKHSPKVPQDTDKVKIKVDTSLRKKYKVPPSKKAT